METKHDQNECNFSSIESIPTCKIAYERAHFKSRRAYFCIGKGKVSDLPEFKENRAVTSLQHSRANDTIGARSSACFE